MKIRMFKVKAVGERGENLGEHIISVEPTPMTMFLGKRDVLTIIEEL